jgi:hypothetical protein
MALDMLSILAMEADTERAFSSGGQMVTPLRNQLLAETIRVAQLLRNWKMAGIF